MRRFLPILLLLGLLVGCLPIAEPKTMPVPITPEPALSPTPSPITTPIQSSPMVLPSIADIVEQVKPAVVSITTESFKPGFFFEPIPRQGAGSGIVFSPDGYILTNNHVIEGAEKILVTFPRSPRFPKGASFSAQVIGKDRNSDLAVIKVDEKNLPTVKFGRASDLRVGDWVIAIGNAQALPGGPSVSLGIVSALGRSISVGDTVLHDLIQTDAAINPGNSGGPLIDLKGEVVGINTVAIGWAQNIGFAIASETAISIKEELLKFGEIRWPWLGVVIITLTPPLAKEVGTSATEGVLITEVRRGDPAERAGLKAGDVIIKFAGIDTPDVLSFQKVIRQFRAGDRVEIIFIRKDQLLSTQVTLARMPR